MNSESLVTKVKQKLTGKYKIVDVDGVRIETQKGWGLLRASNTQPIIVMRFEAESNENLAEIRKIIEDVYNESLKELS
mgnify:FL=1